MEIVSFTPDDGDTVRAALDLRNAVDAADAPWDRPVPLREYTAALRHGWDGEPERPYLLTVDGEAVGLGGVSLTERDNLHLAWLTVKVHPEHRRHGYGTALLEHLVAESVAAGRTSVATDGWETEAAVGFAGRHGLERKAQEIMRRQHLAEVDGALLQKLYDEAAAVATDYELLRLPGRLPEDMLEAASDLTAAINDAPTDDLDIEDDAMSPQRVRDYEEAVLARGHRIYRLVARHRATGELGGHTIIAVEGDRPAYAHQHDTAVARAHRGHRLGLLLKAGMLLWLAEDEPQLETVDTWNAESNDHMIGVNEQLRYRVMGRVLEFQRAVGPASAR